VVSGVNCVTTTGFEMPSFTFGKVAFTAIGATVYWGLAGRTKLRPFLLPDILKHLPWKQAHPILEFLLFLTMGCLVGIGFTDPSNTRQAITAGMGWTGVFVRRKGGS
jgi:hypothetical protein